MVTRTTRTLWAGAVAFALLQLLTTRPASAQVAGPQSGIHVGANSIGGVVTGAKGPEAGVWVIAETNDLPAKYAKIVVTDDEGRYLLPDLPVANYDLWVRGYGLVDSQKVRAEPGKLVNLAASIATGAHQAAQIYPAIYWYSMLKIPDESLFSGPTRDPDMPDSMTSQLQWLNVVKTNGCITCHQIGYLATRTIPSTLGHFDNSADAWERRIQSGQASAQMAASIANFDTKLALTNFGNWTDRIAEGELPAATPPRPSGIERNIVITEWDWASPKTYLHDAISTDKRNPTVNAYGPIDGSPELSTDDIPVLDPIANVATTIFASRSPIRRPRARETRTRSLRPRPTGATS